jgi:GH35 family endo-1,4-beta-xylanase
MSVADDFIEVMARLQAVEPDGNSPMRYAVWRCKEAGYKVIADALQQARDIADAAKMIQRDYADEVKAQAAKPKQEPT